MKRMPKRSAAADREAMLSMGPMEEEESGIPEGDDAPMDPTMPPSGRRKGAPVVVISLGHGEPDDDEAFERELQKAKGMR